MAIATGTAALIAAGIAAGGTVAATKIQANAANKAGRLQKEANDAALAHEKEQENYVRSRYELEDKREQEARAAYQQYLAANGKGPAPGAAGVAGKPTGIQAWALGAQQAMNGGGEQPQAKTLQDLAVTTPDQAGSMADASIGQGQTLQDLSEWNDWKTRGLGV